MKTTSFLNLSKQFRMLLLIVTSGFSLAVNAANEESPADTYYKNLSKIYVLLQNPEFFKGACEAAYPEFKDANQSAYEQWFLKNQDFIKQVDEHVVEFIYESAVEEGKTEADVWVEFNQLMTDGQQLILSGLKQYLKDEEGRDFMSWCENYPRYSKSALTDVKNTYRDDLIQMYEARMFMISDDIDTLLKTRKPSSITDDEKPTVKINSDQLVDLGAMKAGDFILLVSAKVPFPGENATMESLISQLNATDNQIIDESETSLLVLGFKKDKSTNENKPAFHIRYDFKDGVYVRGPVLIKLFE